ncbi:hypothetical protein FA95DRAFT_511504 [Auriscalpium vulgare]|uniref:Uncharacterized protein n=1 Tax=Auriscalpium vulgare TaxID=40419 RepID=A0ACB8RFI9_9AGAM|nr:hypothetical protein FA95DRAFT_511504 [Auriscalpium vulgare]
MSSAGELKDQGNALFAQKAYKDAIGKYSAAIALDGANAVFYSNRAACHLALTAYGKARDDATKATELDPGFSKAWGRLATAQDALGQPAAAAAAWTQALEHLPDTPADAPARASYATRYTQSIARVRATDASVVAPAPAFQPHQRPWARAKALLPRLRREGKLDSSAFVIEYAAAQFEPAVADMLKMQLTVTPMGYLCIGSNVVVEQLSNAILQDHRCFYIAHKNFVDKYNDQVKAELYQAGAHEILPIWSAERLIAAFRTMHAQGGFDKTRPAIATLIRVVFLNAFMRGGLNRRHAEAVADYDKILALQRWGRAEWAHAGTDVRGAVFEQTFVRGVRAVRIEAYQQAWQADHASGRFSLAALDAEADALLADIAAQPPHDLAGYPGFRSAFWAYPAGRALSMKGFAAFQAVRSGEYADPEDARAKLRRASELYFAAADKYPQDDESHVCAYFPPPLPCSAPSPSPSPRAGFLKIGLDALLIAGTPLRACLPVVERMRAALPAMRAIWAHSTMALEGRDRVLQDVLDWDVAVRARVARGEVALEDRVRPAWLDSTGVRLF